MTQNLPIIDISILPSYCLPFLLLSRLTPENNENRTNGRVRFDASMGDASSCTAAHDVPELHVLRKSSIDGPDEIRQIRNRRYYSIAVEFMQFHA